MWQETHIAAARVGVRFGRRLEERDATPETGKFWVYERAICAAYYGIFESVSASQEMYKLVEGRYQMMEPNLNGRYFIPSLSVELGVWRGFYMGKTANWLRWWDTLGNLLDDGWEGKEQRRWRKSRPNSERSKRSGKRGKRSGKQNKRSGKQNKRSSKRGWRRTSAACGAKTQQEHLAKEQAERRAEQLAAKLRSLGINPDA